MNPQNVIPIGIRILGLVFLYHALMAVPRFVLALVKSFSDLKLEALLSSTLLFVWPLLLAYWMLRGAPQLQRIVESGLKSRSTQVE